MNMRMILLGTVSHDALLAALPVQIFNLVKGLDGLRGRKPEGGAE